MSATADRPARAKKVSHRQAALLLAERDPVLARLVEQAGLPTFAAPTDTHFAMLVRSITYQQLAGAAAKAIHGRLVAALDGEVTPEQVLAVPPALLRAAGLSGNKVARCSTWPRRSKKAPSSWRRGGYRGRATRRSSPGSPRSAASVTGPPRSS